MQAEPSLAERRRPWVRCTCWVLLNVLVLISAFLVKVDSTFFGWHGLHVRESTLIAIGLLVPSVYGLARLCSTPCGGAFRATAATTCVVMLAISIGLLLGDDAVQSHAALSPPASLMDALWNLTPVDDVARSVASACFSGPRSPIWFRLILCIIVMTAATLGCLAVRRAAVDDGGS